MKIKRFKEAVSGIKASNLEGSVTLYRLTSHPVVDLSQPGEYYVTSKSYIDSDMLKSKKGELYLLTVKTDAKNIDLNKSEKECAKNNNTGIVAVKNDKKCDVVKVEPYTNK
jgi:hypothetical protein